MTHHTQIKPLDVNHNNITSDGVYLLCARDYIFINSHQFEYLQYNMQKYQYFKPNISKGLITLDLNIIKRKQFEQIPYND